MVKDLFLFCLLGLSFPVLASSPNAYQADHLGRIALEQAHQITPDWDPSQRDCAGFVRYVYRQGLSTSAKIWKNLAGQWVDYVGAAELVSHNFQLLSRHPLPHELRSGDLLAYYNPYKPPQEAWHLMVVVKSPGNRSHQTLLVYHNGDRGPKAAIRKLRWSNLSDQVSIWQPSAQNPLFQGAYRWRGWENEDTKKMALKKNNSKESP